MYKTATSDAPILYPPALWSWSLKVCNDSEAWHFRKGVEVEKYKNARVYFSDFVWPQDTVFNFKDGQAASECTI